MMSYLFFFSYSSANDAHDAYLATFYKDLVDRMRELHPPLPGSGMEVAFRDNQTKRGEGWESTICDALMNSAVLVCIYSPDYFLSEFCGKEWHVFHMRRRSYIEAGGRPPLPATIKPVIWLPAPDFLTPEHVHPDVLEVQYTTGKRSAEYNTVGVKQLLRKKSGKNKNAYLDFIDDLVDDIHAASKLEPPLPGLATWPNLSEVIPMFPHRKDSGANAIVLHSHLQGMAPLVFAIAGPMSWKQDDAAGAWPPAAQNACEIMLRRIASAELNLPCAIEPSVSWGELPSVIDRTVRHGQVLVVISSQPLPQEAVLQTNCIDLRIQGAGSISGEEQLKAELVDKVLRTRQQVRATSNVSLPTMAMPKPVVSATIARPGEHYGS